MPTRNSVCRAIIAATAVLFLSMASARADDPQALKDRLHAAEKDTSLDSGEVAPFYLKMPVQLFDAKGKPSEQGTVELYWAGPHHEKRVYTFPSYSATEIHIDDNMFRTPNANYPPEMVTVLLDQLLHPMPRVEAIDKSQPVMQKINFGKVPLDCIMLASNLGRSATIPMGLFPTYCLGNSDNTLRIALRYGGQVVLRNTTSIFQQRRVALDVIVEVNNVQAAEGKIEKLEQRSITDAELSTDGVPLLTTGLKFTGTGDAMKASAGLVAGLVTNKVDPVYPASSKANHIQGTVVLHAIIGHDGHIQDLQVVSSPDADLAIAAVVAVRQWQYRPYLLKGVPVDVDTTININFTLGP